MTSRVAIVVRLLAIVLASMLAARAFAGVVTLKPGAAVAPGAPITLADVATLEGADAQALADVPLGVFETTREVTVDEVRRALDARKVNWGRVALRGSACPVRASAPPTSETSPSSETPSPIAPASGVETVRDRIVATLRELFGAAPDAIRVTLDDANAGLLARAVQGRRVDIETSSANSSRLAVRVWMYEGDRLVGEGTVRADVSLRLDVFTLASSVGKGERITASMLTRATVWLAPAGAPPIREESQAVGAVARVRLDAGTVLRTEHVESPVVIKRGDLVSVHALAGGMVVRTQARANADAREGEMVELSRGRDRKPFLARAAAPGLAIIEAGSRGDDR